jgi:hypothetical protein
MSSVLEQVSNHEPCLRERFLQAVKKGELGHIDERGIIITMKEFKLYFSDIKTDYIRSFLPASTIEPGRSFMTHTKFVFRLKKGVYLLHPDAII